MGFSELCAAAPPYCASLGAPSPLHPGLGPPSWARGGRHWTQPDDCWSSRVLTVVGRAWDSVGLRHSGTWGHCCPWASVSSVSGVMRPSALRACPAQSASLVLRLGSHRLPSCVSVRLSDGTGSPRSLSLISDFGLADCELFCYSCPARAAMANM